MTEPEHLDLPDGYDPDGGWEPVEWIDALRPADFDDEELPLDEHLAALGERYRAVRDLDVKGGLL